MSDSGFQRTLQTAADAEATARLLARVALEARSYRDKTALEALGQRYSDYAAALRETAAGEPAEAPDDQVALL